MQAYDTENGEYELDLYRYEGERVESYISVAIRVAMIMKGDEAMWCGGDPCFDSAVD
jgi:hypothetical protein